MQTQIIDHIVNDILTDMSNRKKETDVTTDTSASPDLEDVFEKLIQDQDQTSRDVMRRIWKQLH